ncbi:MAG: hypothetical protein S0880_11195 [Actinomycetota bacterium]|nr:hypothetical protein [Actinomycetota bacterium]
MIVVLVLAMPALAAGLAWTALEPRRIMKQQAETWTCRHPGADDVDRALQRSNRVTAGVTAVVLAGFAMFVALQSVVPTLGADARCNELLAALEPVWVTEDGRLDGSTIRAVADEHGDYALEYRSTPGFMNRVTIDVGGALLVGQTFNGGSSSITCVDV